MTICYVYMTDRGKFKVNRKYVCYMLLNKQKIRTENHQYLLCIFRLFTLSHVNNHEKGDNDTSESRMLHGDRKKVLLKKLLLFWYQVAEKNL